MITLVKIIPLPIFIIAMLGITIALFSYGIKSRHGKYREFSYFYFTVALAGPIAIFARCVDDFSPVNSPLRSVSLAILLVTLGIVLFMTFRIIWRRYKKGLIRGQQRALISVAFGALIFGGCLAVIIAILMALGV